MATTNRTKMQSNRKGLVDRLFLEHPRSLGMTWASHASGAVKIGAELVGAGCAAIIHAVVPAWFTETAGRTVARIHDHVQQRKSGADNPNDWPDYEI